MADRLLNSREVAEWLNVPLSTLAYWAYVGEGPPFTKIGQRRRYRRSAVEHYITSREVGAVDSPVSTAMTRDGGR
jgi:excisionase family DNA binding protein